MTAPALTPTEHAEVTRFGVHDEEILRDLAEHANDTIRCEVHPSVNAEWRLANRCCGYALFFCQPCRDAVFKEEIPKEKKVCVSCGHRTPKGTPYADVIREVQL